MPDDLDDLDDLDDGTDDAQTDDDGNGADGGGADGAGLLAAVAALGEKLDRLVGPDDDDGNGADTVTRTQNQQREVDVEGQVRRALARVGKERETDERLAKVERAVERPPAKKQGPLSRLLWGKVDA